MILSEDEGDLVIELVVLVVMDVVISFDEVCFGYLEVVYKIEKEKVIVVVVGEDVFLLRDMEVLYGVIFDVLCGLWVVFVGLSGVGKSMIFLLIECFYDLIGGVVCLGGLDVCGILCDFLCV